MSLPARKPPPPPGAVAQPMKTFDAIRSAQTANGKGAGEELVAASRDLFQVRQADRGVMVRPNGTYNFVRVAGETRARAQTLISSKAGHAAIAGGRPVLYAGTVRFDNGALDWWSNYSGTYQPIAAFRAQASLPEDRFMPWQKLQMGGIGMQRNTFRDQRQMLDPARTTSADKAAASPADASPAAAAAAVPSAGSDRSAAPKAASAKSTPAPTAVARPAATAKPITAPALPERQPVTVTTAVKTVTVPASAPRAAAPPVQAKRARPPAVWPGGRR